ncbi:MAG: aldehyde-activating protein [Pseudomonadota bacterium]|jgi:hypothetical protein
MLKFSCLCGQVQISVTKRPDYINECNCRLCSASGARWGYFHPSEVTVVGATQGYCRSDKQSPFAQVHFCRTCGATTHFVMTESAIAKFGGDSVIGVNMWLADAEELAGIELRFPDGRAWSGEGGFDYVRPPHIIGA